MERNGQAKAVYVAVPASLDRKGGTFLVLVRADLNVLRWIVIARGGGTCGSTAAVATEDPA